MGLLSLYHWLLAAAEEVSVTDDPVQISIAPDAVISGAAALLITVITTLLVLEQPVAGMVSVNVYVVVTVGVTVGLDNVEVKPAGDDVQLYVFPATGGPPSCVLLLEQIVRAAPTVAAGPDNTVITGPFVA